MKFITTKKLALALTVALSAVSVQAGVTRADLIQAKDWDGTALSQPRSWKHTVNTSRFKAENSPRKATTTNSDFKIGPVSTFGTLQGPDGTEWIYTAKFDGDDFTGYKSVYLEIYNGNKELMGTITDTFVLGENETGVNQVQINPNITKKFFNVDDKYEVMVFIHATTKDYTGHLYNHVFTIGGDQTEPLLTIDGNQVLMEDFATDAYMEHYQMVFMREEFEGDSFKMHYDIYGYADWSSLRAPRLLHTFSIDYNYISGMGDAGLPLFLKSVNGKPVYVLTSYEKPYFDPSIPVWEEPVVTPDNTFIIDLYDGTQFDGKNTDVKPYSTVRIPMEAEPGYLYTFPCLGPLMGYDDVSFGFFDDTDNPCFVVSHENYVTASDEFMVSFYLYDHQGNKVRTLAEDVEGYYQLCSVPGAELQYVTYNIDEGCYRFLNLPSGEFGPSIPFTYEDLTLSESMDRVPVGGSYQYVFSGTNGLPLPDGSVAHPMAWFNADGTFNRWENINLGKDIYMAQVAVLGEWLNPFLFDTDPAYDYMVLVKKAGPNYANDSKLEEHLYVRSSNGKSLLDFGPSPEMGGNIDNVWLVNTTKENPMLVVDYYEWTADQYTIHFTDLPLEMFGGGSGTEADPYLIATAGDLLMVGKAPTAYFKVVADIDFNGATASGTEAAFSGTIDGQNHTVSNLSLSGASLFGELQGAACIHDLTFDKPTVTPAGIYSGLVASSAVYDGTTAPTIERIRINDMVVNSDDYDETFGGIIGHATTGTSLVGCYVADADIDLPRATVGGIVGSIPASEATIGCSAFSGKITAAVAGGIVGEGIGLHINDVHADADITAGVTAGGIVGSMGEYMQSRGTVTRAVFEGSLTSTADDDPSLGGIVGTIEGGDGTAVSQCYVNISALNVQPGVTVMSAHRIAGHTCADEPGEILWDDPWWETVSDPYADPSLWPRAEVAPDAGFTDNFASTGSAAVAAELAEQPNSVEGRTLSAGEASESFFTALGYAFGTTTATPWQMLGETPVLYFENSLCSAPGIVVEPVSPIAYDGSTITAEGLISIYDLRGRCILIGSDSISTASLPKGIYLARTATKTLKIAVK